MTREFPDDCLQAVVPPWWTVVEDRRIRRGHLIWAFVPHVDQVPLGLFMEGRSSPTNHQRARYRVEPLDVSQRPAGPRLPVAALPDYPGEVRAVYRAKSRPAIVLSTGGHDVPKELRRGSARWQTAPTLLVAPYYGAGRSERRGGWRPELTERIRSCHYPQYIWDRLPIGASEESILRLDHCQPIGRHPSACRWTPHCLHSDALVVLDEWLEWFIRGEIPSDGILAMILQEIRNWNQAR